MFFTWFIPPQYDNARAAEVCHLTHAYQFSREIRASWQHKSYIRMVAVIQCLLVSREVTGDHVISCM